MVTADNPGVAPGWYLLECQAQGTAAGHDIWMSAVDSSATPVRIPLRPEVGGRICRVVLLARVTYDLEVRSSVPVAPLSFTLLPIARGEAVRRMLAGLRNDSGRNDWPLILRTLGRMAMLAITDNITASGDALVAAYLGRSRYGQRCDLRIGWHWQRARFEPLEELVSVAGESGGRDWETAGEDPKMRLCRDGVPMQLPSGWYLFDACMHRREGQLIGPALYPDYGDLLAEQEIIELPTPGPDGVIRSLAMFKYPVRQLRFDPTRRQARFGIDRLRLRRVGRLEALARMLPVRNDAGRVDWKASTRSLGEFAGTVRRHGLSRAAAEAFARHQRREADASRSYRAWVRRYDTIGAAERAMFERRAERLTDGPVFSILLPVYETPERWLRRCLDSVLAQVYPHWELCIADDASSSPHVRRVIEAYVTLDSRVRANFRAENGHISAASNTALGMASGEFIALLDHDDELRPHALLEMAEAIAKNPGLGMLYSDEDKIDEHGRRCEPYFKPDWNPDLLLGQNYACHLTAIRTTLAREAGGFRRGFEGSQDHDLVLRCSRKLTALEIHHVPRVLYHWRAIPGSTALHRESKDYAAVAGARAVQEHVKFESPKALVELMEHGHYRVRWPLPDPSPRVSLIVPTRDRPELLRTCVDSLLERTEYPDFEVLVVDNRSSDLEALAILESLRDRERVTVLRYDAPFNYSAINNWAVRRASGSVLALVNNDIEVITPDWLAEMVGYAMRPGTGAVGSMLLYPDGRIQHAGVILGLGGIANHAYVGEPAEISGHGGRAKVAQAMSAVTGACLVVRRDRFEEVGGLDERLQVAFNDIDFCLRLRQAGYRNIWTPFARLYHHESASRGSDVDGEKRERFLGEIALMEARWGGQLKRDPAYNPNLALTGRGFELADPPRT